MGGCKVVRDPYLDISACSSLNEASIFSLVSLFPNLKTLVIYSPEQIEKIIGRIQKQHCPELTEIELLKPPLFFKKKNLTIKPNTSEQELLLLLQLYPELETLNLNDLEVIPWIPKILEKSPKLKLIFKIWDMKATTPTNSQRMPKEELARSTPVLTEFKDYRNLDEHELIKLISFCPNLTYINLEDYNHVTLKGIQDILTKCSNLCQIKLPKILAGNRNFSQYTPPMFNSFNSFLESDNFNELNEGISELNISNCPNLTKESIISLLSIFPRIKSMTLYHREQVKGMALIIRTKFPQIILNCLHQPLVDLVGKLHIPENYDQQTLELIFQLYPNIRCLCFSSDNFYSIENIMARWPKIHTIRFVRGYEDEGTKYGISYPNLKIYSNAFVPKDYDLV